MESSVQQESRIRLYFRISIILKGVISFFEIVGGLLAFFVPISAFTDIVVRLAQGELAEEPGDFIATHLVNLAHSFAFQNGVFIGLYLLSRGLIKLVLIIAMLNNKLWAYPSSLVVLALFVIYQLYQIATTHSILVVVLTIFDFIVMYFIWREYELIRLEMLK